MRLSRRLILKSAGALPLLAGSFGLPLFGVRAWAHSLHEDVQQLRRETY